MLIKRRRCFNNNSAIKVVTQCLGIQVKGIVWTVNKELFILIDCNCNLRAHVRTDGTPCTFRSLHWAHNKMPHLVKLLCHRNYLHRAGLNAVAAAFA